MTEKPNLYKNIKDYLTTPSGQKRFEDLDVGSKVTLNTSTLNKFPSKEEVFVSGIEFVVAKKIYSPKLHGKKYLDLVVREPGFLNSLFGQKYFASSEYVF